MHIPDLINASFELFSGLFIIMNIRRIYKDKEVKGVSILATSFFLLWGLWNLYYYPSLGQWLSFFGGISISVFNGIWVGLMVYYTILNRKKRRQECVNQGFLANCDDNKRITKE